MATPRPQISETEMEVLKVLWDEGPGTVRTLNERLRSKRRRWAYTTVQTLLNRLKEKGYVARDESSMAHVFRASVTRDRFLSWRLREIADQVCGGQASPLVTSLVRQKGLSEEEIGSLRNLLDEIEGTERDKKRGGRKR